MRQLDSKCYMKVSLKVFNWILGLLVKNSYKDSGDRASTHHSKTRARVTDKVQTADRVKKSRRKMFFELFKRRKYINI